MVDRCSVSIYPLSARVPPEQMTGRARAYLTVVALRNLAMAAGALLLADRFTSPAFHYILEAAPLTGWGFAFVAIGTISGVAALIGSEPLARCGLALSATSVGAWAGGFIAATIWAPGAVHSGPTGMILAVSITAKDLIVCRQPIRSPFERMTRQLRTDSEV